MVGLNPEAVRPHVVVLYEGNAPKALLAGRLELSHVPIKLGYIDFPVPKLRVLQFVHGGWLGDLSEANAELFVRSIVEALNAGEADAAMLHYPELGSALVRFARTLPPRHCVDYAISPQRRCVRERSETSRTFAASLSKKERYHHRNRARNIAKDFRCSRIEEFSELNKFERLTRDVETVARQSYQRGLGVGFSLTPTILSRLEFEASKGWLRAYVLYLDDTPCSFWIGSLRDGVFLSDYLGFDPAYAKYGPGLHLIVKVMEELFDDPRDGLVTERIDFGIGEASYKMRLSNSEWQEAIIYIFAPRLKAVSVNALRSTVGMINSCAKRILRATGMLESVKRVWRGRM
jgi:hypothetical protein